MNRGCSTPCAASATSSGCREPALAHRARPRRGGRAGRRAGRRPAPTSRRPGSSGTAWTRRSWPGRGRSTPWAAGPVTRPPVADRFVRCPSAGSVQPAAAAQLVLYDGRVLSCIEGGPTLPVDDEDLAVAGDERGLPAAVRVRRRHVLSPAHDPVARGRRPADRPRPVRAGGDARPAPAAAGRPDAGRRGGGRRPGLGAGRADRAARAAAARRGGGHRSHERPEHAPAHRRARRGRQPGPQPEHDGRRARRRPARSSSAWWKTPATSCGRR